MATKSKSSPKLLLLPQPQRVTIRPGKFAFAERVIVHMPVDSTRLELMAASQLCDDLEGLEREATTRRPGLRGQLPEGGVRMRHGKVRGGDEGYHIVIGKAGVDITGGSDRGLYYGLQTLRQLIRQFGLELPAMRIDDWPEMALRGVYHDISRGRVPTVETLLYMIELLAHLKINTFSLYIEYPYRFEKHPRIWEDTQPLTSDEILILQEHCHNHGIDFVPSFASFGHLERVLSKPPYQHLANTTPNDLQGARQFRRTGTSLNPTDRGSVRLLSELYDEFLPQFDSKFFNATCDEVWDLGEGKSKGKADRVGKGRVFADFIVEINKLANKHGKQLMIWADILKHHSDAIGPIPKDVVFLNWWYNADSPEWMVDHSRAIKESGHPLVVCPGVNNWGAFMPRLERMRANISQFADAGLKFGALGLMNTEWGDGGHFNLLATALPGFASGAEHAWAHSKADEATIGKRWPLHLLEDVSGDAERVVALADWRGEWYKGITTGFGDEREISELQAPADKLLQQMTDFRQRLEEAHDLALDLAERLPPDGSVAALEYAALTYMTMAKAEAIIGRLKEEAGDKAAARKHYATAGEAITEIIPHYKELWLMRNRPSEMNWSLKRIQEMQKRWQKAAKATPRKKAKANTKAKSASPKKAATGAKAGKAKSTPKKTSKRKKA